MGGLLLRNVAMMLSMKIEQIAVILYTLRDFVQTEEGLRESLEKLKKIGFQSIQVSGIGPDGPSAEFIRKSCDDLELAIAATHEPSEGLLKDPAAAADRLDILGTDYTAYPMPHGVDLADEGAVSEWLADLESAAQVLRRRGKILTYHNHALEFYRLRGKTIYERIYKETSLLAELDTYWVQAGGASVLGWVKTLAKERKLPLLHLKDMTIELPNEQRFSPVGSGNIDFDPIVEAAEAGECRYYIVEQDNCWGRDPFDCIEESFLYLRDRYVCRVR